MDDPKIASCAVELRPKSELGLTQWGGLSGRHHFSFAAYQRLDRLEWGALRALHLYELKAGEARAPTFHAGFEILTLVRGGRLSRIGSHDPREPLDQGSVELVSTGRGANLGVKASGEEAAQYIEIWIRSAPPVRRSRRQCRASVIRSLDRPVASNIRGQAECLAWQSEAEVYLASMAAGEQADRAIAEGKCAYLVVLAGEIEGNGAVAKTQDALAISGPGLLSLRSRAPSEFLLIRMSNQVASPDLGG